MLGMALLTYTTCIHVMIIGKIQDLMLQGCRILIFLITAASWKGRRKLQVYTKAMSCLRKINK